jgi:hypothetical protein
MGEMHREQVDLIPDPGAGGDIGERVVGFELGEDPLLAAPAESHCAAPRRQKRRASMRALRSVKRSKGTLTVYSTPAASRLPTMSSLEKALSIRTSIETPGRAARTTAIQVRMNRDYMDVMLLGGTG